MAASPTPRLTPEEYLALDRAAEFKSEYYGGQMYAMSGGSLVHALIIGNVIAALNNALRGTECIVFSSEARLRVAVDGLYTFPDATVVCGGMKVADDHNDTLLNPVLIVEVLSKSTEAHDRGFKFAQYRRLESLQEYMLISQTEPRVELFQCQSSWWKLTETIGLDGMCRISTMDKTLSMADIYANVSGF